MSTAEMLEQLARIYRHGGSSPFLDQAVNKLLAHELEETRRQAVEIGARLAEFERQHGLVSHDFYARYDRGLMGDSAEFFEWASLVKMSLALGERLRLLETRRND